MLPRRSNSFSEKVIRADRFEKSLGVKLPPSSGHVHSPDSVPPALSTVSQRVPFSPPQLLV